MKKKRISAPIILAQADTRSGLAISRSFAKHDIPFIPAVVNTKQFCCASRYIRNRLVAVANPRLEPDRFADQVLSIAIENSASAILPVTDAALGSLNAARRRIPKSICLMAPHSDAIDAVLEKHLNVAIAESNGVPYPQTVNVESFREFAVAASTVGYPVILKRRSQQQVIPIEVSDFTVEEVQNEEELNEVINRLAKYDVLPQLQKFIVGDMHNICCFAVKGKIVAAQEVISIRRGKHAGIVRKIVPTDQTRLSYAERMLGSIEWEGLAGVSFLVEKQTNNSWYLETNGRFWASVQGNINAGWDFPYWVAQYFLNGEIPVIPETNRDPPITSYHTADLSVLIRFLGGGPPPAPGFNGGRLKAIWQYFRAFGPGYSSDVFRCSDPRPAVVDHMQLFGRYWRAVVRRLKRQER